VLLVPPVLEPPVVPALLVPLELAPVLVVEAVVEAAPVVLETPVVEPLVPEDPELQAVTRASTLPARIRLVPFVWFNAGLPFAAWFRPRRAV
jgi:hypothetical protein